MKKMTEGSPARLIIAFAIPMMIGNLFQQLYNMADMFIVGHTLGPDKLGAIGCTSSISMIILHIAIGLTGGFCVLTARYFGANDEGNVRKSFATGILLSVIAVVLITVIGLIVLKPFMRFLNTREELFDDAYSYIRIIVAGTCATLFYNYFAGVLRGLGDSRRPLYILIAASILNIALDYLLILVFDMGVAGAATATITSQTFSAVCCYVIIRKTIPMLRVKAADLKTVTGKSIGQHLKIGLPMSFQWSLISVGQLVMQSALNQLSVAAVTAFSTANKLDMFALMPSMSFSSAMAAYVPQNYGARNPERIRKGVRICILMSCAICETIGIIDIIFGEYFAAFFIGSHDPELTGLVHRYLTITGSMYFLHPLLMTYRNAAQGLGRTVAPVLSGVMELIMRFTTATVLVPNFGFTGACFSSPLSWIGSVIPLGIAYYIAIAKFTKEVNEERAQASP